jgi:peroxiredoxin-like protein
MEPHSYNVSLQWTEGRKGLMEAPGLPQKIEVATPPEFDKGVPGIWSPEHLYTASILSCFMTTFLAIAEYSQLDYSTFSCKAEGVLDKVEGKYQMTEVNLFPVLTIGDASKKDKAVRILEKSEAACLISNSVKTNVHLHPEIVVQ